VVSDVTTNGDISTRPEAGNKYFLKLQITTENTARTGLVSSPDPAEFGTRFARSQQSDGYGVGKRHLLEEVGCNAYVYRSRVGELFT